MTEIGLKLKKMTSQAIDWKKRYKEYDYPFKDDSIVFLPLRHFNSDTPITPGLWENIPYNIAEKPLSRQYGGRMVLYPSLIGGGYYISYKNKGIAIDPGHGFVDSLHRYHGITVKDIDSVIITHDHMDHHADLETILTLRRGAGSILQLYVNKEVDDVYKLSRRQLVPRSNIETIIVNSDSKPINISSTITVKFLPAMHWQRVREIDNAGNLLSPIELIKSHFNTFGLYIKTKEKRFLITSDTLFPVRKGKDWFAYTKTMSPYTEAKNAVKLGWTHSSILTVKTKIERIINEQCKKMMKEYKALDKVDIACLHIGSLEKGLQNLPDNFTIKNISSIIDDPAYCYPGFHLGLTGALRLCRFLINNKKFDYMKDLLILTEFGEELLGNRQNICNIFKELLGSMMSKKKGNNSCPFVIPSEVTLRIYKDYTTPIGIKCSYCNKIHPWNEIAGEEGPGEIIQYVAKGAKENIHPNCTCWKY